MYRASNIQDRFLRLKPIMNISGSDTSCYTNLSPGPAGLSLQMYSMADQGHHDDRDHHDQVDPSNSHLQPNNSTACSSLLYSLSILKDKVHQLQSLVAILLSPEAADSSASMAGINMQNAIQEIVMIASSMLLNLQHTGLASTSGNPSTTDHDNNNNNISPYPNITGNVSLSSSKSVGPGLIYPSTHDHHQTVLDWYGSPHDDQTYINSTTCTGSSIKENKYNSTTSNRMIITQYSKDHRAEENMFPSLALGSETKNGRGAVSASRNHDIIELDAANLLAKYTHYCQVCGKGFKRDANLRMHMRAHGDEYKTSSALSNPMKRINDDLIGNINRGFSTAKKYSCPQEGCRWNQRHAKFQPLKSMICVKNHYKRSHCPKMYVCKKCNRKQFSVLSDLRTHEKHCGDLKWQCSCGTTFSRKDKLMGHVSLFVGHTPVMMNDATSSSANNNNKTTNVESQLVSHVDQMDGIVKMME